MKNGKKKGKRVLIYFFTVLFTFWSLAHVIWMFISSITPTNELMDLKHIFSSLFTLDRYKLLFLGEQVAGVNVNALKQSELFRHALGNSLFVSISATVVSVAIGASASFAFAKLKFRGSKFIQFSALFFQLLPPVAILIPYYVAAAKLGALDKLPTLIIVYINSVLVYVIWVMTSYFKSLPDDLIHAARVDGCSYLGAYIRVILPSALPGFVTVGVLAFLMCWDEFMYALVFMQSDANKTITVAVSEFGTKYSIDYGLMMAGGVVATVIPALFVLFFQRYIVSGLTSGAIKE